MFSGEWDLFSKHFALRLQAGSLWLGMQNLGLSPDSSALILGADDATIRALWKKLRDFLCPIVDRMHEELHIGGEGQDIELDEIAF